MKLNLKYYNQRKDVIDDEWKPKACLIVCSKMILDFLGNKEISIDDLIKEGICIGAWNGKLWEHQGIVRLLRNHGLFGYSQEFKTVDVNIENGEMKTGLMSNKFFEKGISKIAEKIDAGIPTIVSIYKYFTEKDRPHGIVIIGYEKDKSGKVKGFYYHDPETSEEGDGKNLFVELDKFKNGWKRLAIFTDK